MRRINLAWTKLNVNKEERFSRVPRLSDTRYSAKGTKGGNGDMQAAKRDKSATYRSVDRFKRYGRYSGRGKFALQICAALKATESKISTFIFTFFLSLWADCGQ